MPGVASLDVEREECCKLQVQGRQALHCGLTSLPLEDITPNAGNETPVEDSHPPAWPETQGGRARTLFAAQDWLKDGALPS